MKARMNQMVIVVLLLVVITSIVLYTWIGLTELIHSFDHAASESIANMKIKGF